MFVLLDGGLEPLLGVFEEVRMGEEGDSEGDVRSWWCQVSVFECLVDNAKGSAPTWLPCVEWHRLPGQYGGR